jgi:hypothetical protein
MPLHAQALSFMASRVWGSSSLINPAIALFSPGVASGTQLLRARPNPHDVPFHCPASATPSIPEAPALNAVVASGRASFAKTIKNVCEFTV